MTRENSPNPPPRPRHRRQGSCFFWFLTGGLLGALAVAIAWMMDERAAAGPVTANAPRAAQTQPKLRYQYPTILPELEVVVPDEDTSDRPPALPPPPPSPEELKALAKEAASKDAAKAGAKEPVKEIAKPPAKEAGKEPAKPSSKETAKTPAKEPVKEPAKTVKTPEKPPAKPAEQAAKPPEAASTGGDNETYILQVASLGSPEEAERFKAKLTQQGIAVSIQQASVDGKTHYRVRTGPLKGKEAASKAKSQLASKGFSPMMIKLK